MTSRVPVILAYLLVFLPALKADSGLITTVAGNGVQGSAGAGGPAIYANMNFPHGVCLDAAQNLYIADWGNSRVLRVKHATGILDVAAGTGQAGYSGDGGPATSAALRGPFACAVDPAGNLLISDSGNNVVRRVDAQSGVITTIAGDGVAGFGGDGGPAALASLRNPVALALDAAGNLYIADSMNSRVRRVDAATGVITTAAGSGICTTPYSSDGSPATAAGLCRPLGVALDSAGDLFLSDYGHRRIMRVDAASGLIQSVAGNGDESFGGDGRLATTTGIGQPAFLAVDDSGYLFFGGGNSGRVQRVNLVTGMIVTVAGNGTVFSTGVASSGSGGGAPPVGAAGPGTPAPGDGGPATSAVVDWAMGLTVAPGGNLFVSEFSHRVRRVFLPAPYSYTAISLVSSGRVTTDGDPVTFTATVSPVEAEGVPGGTVAFMDSDGQTVQTLATGPLENGTASVTVPLAASYKRTYHRITAVYSGDAAFAGSTSPGITQEVQLRSSLALSSNPSPSDPNQPVTLTARVLYSGVLPSGTVEFRDGGTTLGTAAVMQAAASLSVTFDTPGEHQLVAVYSGDTNYAGSTSPAVVQVVKTATTTALVSSPNPSLPGEAITLTATVSPAGATGTVQFLSDGAPVATAPVADGTASAELTSLASGAHAITAVYSGDANHGGSTSAAVAQLVKAGSSVALSSSLQPSREGDVVRFTATVSPATATGAVTFLDGGAALGTSKLSGGQAGLSVSGLTPGTHTVTAVYDGDGDHAGSSSPALIQTVLKNTALVVAGTGPNPSVWGQTVTFTATLTPSQATGTVEFLDGGVALGAGTLSGGQAALSIPSLAPGQHAITAVYSGDSEHAGSSSAAFIQTVSKANTAVAAGSSPNPSVWGQTVTLTATVTPSQATGTVQFLDGGVALGTRTLSGGQAALSVSNLAPGEHTITAVYSGDDEHAGSSSAFVQAVSKANAAVAAGSGPNPSVWGQTVTLTATVTPSQATGTVQFFDGSTPMGSAALAGGRAELVVAQLAVGSHSITAGYGGDGNYLGATSAAAIHVVNRAPTSVAVTSSLNPCTRKQAVTFTAIVTPAVAAGTVQFFDGTALLGSAPVTAGQAAITLTLPVGTHAITAQYGGSGQYAGSTSGVLTQSVTRN